MKETRDQIHMWKSKVIKRLNYAIAWSCEVCTIDFGGFRVLKICRRWLGICEVSRRYN
jgi:hypothetical protein